MVEEGGGYKEEESQEVWVDNENKITHSIGVCCFD